VQIILGFAPFIAFALLTRVTGVDASLWAAAAIAAALAARGRFAGRSIKILEAGTIVLFGILALYVTVTPSEWSLPLVRVVVDSGLLAIVLISMAVRQPFTLQYAREQVSPKVQASAAFLRVNYVITAAWALALAIGVLADLAMEYAPGLPLWLDIAVLVAALFGAARFTQWYPAHVRKVWDAGSRSA
jgi:hypothetical protein